MAAAASAAPAARAAAGGRAPGSVNWKETHFVGESLPTVAGAICSCSCGHSPRPLRPNAALADILERYTFPVTDAQMAEVAALFKLGTGVERLPRAIKKKCEDLASSSRTGA